MIVVTLEKRDDVVRIHVRDMRSVRPLTQIRTVTANILDQIAKDWETLYFRCEALKKSGQTAAFPEIESRIRRKGRLLFSLLFGRGKRSLGATTVVFAIDASLSRVPFEIIHDATGFVCERIPILREIVSAHEETEKHSHRPESSDRVLLLSDGSYSREIEESVSRERTELVKIFRNRSGLTAKIIQKGASSVNILEDLGDCRYLHYAGHYDAGTPDDFILNAQSLNGLDLGQIEVAFLSACHSTLTEQNDRSLAVSMLRAGVKNLVGYGLPVETRAAEQISVLFWDQILRGVDSVCVVHESRLALRKQNGPASLEWLSLQNFGTFKHSEPVRSASD